MEWGGEGEGGRRGLKFWSETRLIEEKERGEGEFIETIRKYQSSFCTDSRIKLRTKMMVMVFVNYEWLNWVFFSAYKTELLLDAHMHINTVNFGLRYVIVSPPQNLLEQKKITNYFRADTSNHVSTLINVSQIHMITKTWKILRKRGARKQVCHSITVQYLIRKDPSG